MSGIVGNKPYSTQKEHIIVKRENNLSRRTISGTNEYIDTSDIRIQFNERNWGNSFLLSLNNRVSQVINRVGRENVRDIVHIIANIVEQNGIVQPAVSGGLAELMRRFIDRWYNNPEALQNTIRNNDGVNNTLRFQVSPSNDDEIEVVIHRANSW